MAGHPLIDQASRPLGIAVLGSTGSVGRQTLDVIDADPTRFRVIALAARSPSELFATQVARFRPSLVALAELPVPPLLPSVRPSVGKRGLIEAATHPDVDIVVVATSGHHAIEPTIRAIEHGKTIALANKETLVSAGELIMPLAARHHVAIRPVDSEHSAIWQAMGNAPPTAVNRIFITASGGPFRTTPAGDLMFVKAKQALAHPTWKMGDKITIDSATMMNKGLEVIEAHWLFGLDYDRIDVLIHPESVVHSIVEFVDGSQLAQLGVPDMRLPIQFALTYPERVPRNGERLDLAKTAALHFEPPDTQRFPCLKLARQAGATGGTYPTVLSAADDVAVAAFLSDAIRFVDIPAVVQEVLDRHRSESPLTLQSIAEADRWARSEAASVITRISGRR